MGSRAPSRWEGPFSSASSSARTSVLAAVSSPHEDLLDRTVTLAVDLRALGRTNPLPFLTMLTPAGRVPLRQVTGTSFTYNDGIGCGHDNAVDHWLFQRIRRYRREGRNQGCKGCGLCKYVQVSSVDPVPGLATFQQ